MLEHFKGDEVFVKKVLDYKDQALNKQRLILTKFLNPHEISVVESVIGKGEVVCYKYGGFKNAESQRMIICPDYFEILPEDFDIVVAQVIYNDHFGKLAHKDVLGALMSLGIERNCIGDIDDRDDVYFACLAGSYDYIYENLTQIKRSKVHLQRVDEEIEIKREYIQKTFVVSSFRIDKLISVLFKVPRSKVKSYIEMGYVKVNHKEVAQASYLCNNNDVISLRKHGRVIIVDEHRVTKQNNHVISGYFYK